MDKNRGQGIGKKIAGKVKETFGKASGDKKTETEGRRDQTTGKTQQTYGEAKDKLKGK